jgi:predicted pyridoxine 5'-phosphate oxidase superfamily flavin-nucleotide-binding protein
MDRYHSGELEAQRLAGASEFAERVGRIIGPSIPAPAAAFLSHRSFVVAATVGADGSPHASILGGGRGFARALDPTTLELRPTAGDLETVGDDLRSTGTIGLLAIDFPTKRRMRANGTASLLDGTIALSTREVYSNCPQYIHPRDETPWIAASVTDEAAQLSQSQQELVSAADTFFIASSHPERGADASHRGGDPGFVTVTSSSVSWPDYPGNNMFNTLGNLMVHPACSLLFADFASGRTLRIDGRASIDWNEPRRVTVTVDRVLEIH